MSNTPRTDKYRGTWATTAQDGKFIFQLAQELEDENTELRQQLAEAQSENKAIRELMNSYNLGGWTHAIPVMERAQKAERQLAEALEAIAIKAGIKGE